MDRITLDVIGAALLAIAEEMGEALIKSSYSTNIKERQDCSTAVFDLQGEVIAQAEHIPMHLGSLIMIILESPPALSARRTCMTATSSSATIPTRAGAPTCPTSPSPQPVFADGALIGFVANIAHHADGSGRETRSIWDEGLRIPPIRIVEGGRLREDVMELILLNFHLPRERRGDFRAQFAANRLGAARLEELARRYGRETCAAAMDELLAYGERKIRAAIRGIPNGVYPFEDWMDDDGVGGPTRAPARPHHRDGGPDRAGLQGTGPQVPGDINVVYLALVATVYYVAQGRARSRYPSQRRLLPRDRGHRARGLASCNAQPPAPVAWRTQTCQRIADLILGALAPALPERVIAATNGANSAWVFSGTNPTTRQYYVYLETIGGGSGAARRQGRPRRCPGPRHEHVEPPGRMSRDGVPAVRRGIRPGS